jgi:signal transduction histidine kinase
MTRTIGLSALAELGTLALTSSAQAIEELCALTQRLSGVDITVVSEVTADGRYVFRGLENRTGAPLQRGAEIPWEWSLCSRIHAGESPASVPETRDVPALWGSWLRLKEGLGVDWDIRAFCTRDVRLPDGSLFGTVCLHNCEPREFSPDEEALLEVIARLLGQEIWRERAAEALEGTAAALDEALRERIDLAEELRHELRAPLAVIDGYAEAMLDGVVARDDEHVVLVRREATRAQQLLDGLVDLVRLEARLDDDVPAEPTAAAEVAADIHARLLPLASAAGVELRLSAVPARVAVSRRRLEQVWVNLVRNALRAVSDGAGSEIVIVVRVAGDAVELGVEDDGSGLDDDERALVFERFYRGSSGREAGEGSGLGLTVVRRIVEAAGGTITAESAGSRGLRVAAHLPAFEAGPGGPQATLEPPDHFVS